MKLERIYFDENDKRWFMDVYAQEPSPEMTKFKVRPMVMVCPGGGYCFTSDREAEVIALEYLAKGFNTCVVRYPIREDARWPEPLATLSKAVSIIRNRADEFYTIPDKIAVCGFSAGGHLVASLGVHWNDHEVQKKAGVTGEENRPNALILGYPVIKGTEHTHGGTINTLLAGIPEGPEKDRMREYVSCEKHVGPHTPPTFLFHTFTDQAVPVRNSLDFAQALNEHGIPFEMHIYQNGPHGLALCDFRTIWENKEAASWIQHSCDWLWNLFGRP